MLLVPGKDFNPVPVEGTISRFLGGLLQCSEIHEARKPQLLVLMAIAPAYDACDRLV